MPAAGAGRFHSDRTGGIISGGARKRTLATRTEHRAYQPSRFCSLGCGVLVSREVVFS